MERPRRAGLAKKSYCESSTDSGDDSGDDSDAGNGEGFESPATRDSRTSEVAALKSLFGIDEIVEADYANDGDVYPATVTKVTSQRSSAVHGIAYAPLYDIVYADGDVGKNLLEKVKS
jgi:hypothetical protein